MGGFRSSQTGRYLFCPYVIADNVPDHFHENIFLPLIADQVKNFLQAKPCDRGAYPDIRIQRRRRPPSVMISTLAISMSSGISLSLHVQAWVSGRNGGQFR